MPAIKVVLADQELADIDRVRGEVPRERWVRELCSMAVMARDAFGEPCLLKVRGVPSTEVHQKITLKPFVVDGEVRSDAT